MKSVMISIQPKWCELIASGKKKVEVRKTKPTLPTPFKCYIYKSFTFGKYENKNVICNGCGKVIGEFVCDSIDKFTAEFYVESQNKIKYLGGVYEDIRKVFIDDDGEEDFLMETTNQRDNPSDCELLKNACLTFDELKNYIGNGDNGFYSLHITDLKIYDKPKELFEFRTPPCEKNEDYCSNCGYRYRTSYEYSEYDRDRENGKIITRPPQSWGYVEEAQ